jgi:hypothetical protein
MYATRMESKQVNTNAGTASPLPGGKSLLYYVEAQNMNKINAIRQFSCPDGVFVPRRVRESTSQPTAVKLILVGVYG